jgi:CBS domain-containing protein
MKVEEIMTKNPVCCTADSKLQDVAQMMVKNDCGCIPVVENEENKKPVGMITDRDITIRTVAEGKNPLDLTAGDVMTDQVITVTPDSSVEDCCNKMEDNQIRRIAVIDENGGCCGIVAQADVAIKSTESKTAEVVEKISKEAAASSQAS